MTYKRRKELRNKGRALCVIVAFIVCIVLCTVMTYKGMQLRAQNEQYKQIQAELQGKIETEEKRTKELAEYGNYIKTDEFVEKKAQEKFGLVKKEDLVIKTEPADSSNSNN